MSKEKLLFLMNILNAERGLHYTVLFLCSQNLQKFSIDYILTIFYSYTKQFNNSYTLTFDDDAVSILISQTHPLKQLVKLRRVRNEKHEAIQTSNISCALTTYSRNSLCTIHGSFNSRLPARFHRRVCHHNFTLHKNTCVIQFLQYSFASWIVCQLIKTLLIFDECK